MEQYKKERLKILITFIYLLIIGVMAIDTYNGLVEFVIFSLIPIIYWGIRWALGKVSIYLFFPEDD